MAEPLMAFLGIVVPAILNVPEGLPYGASLEVLPY